MARLEVVLALLAAAGALGLGPDVATLQESELVEGMSPLALSSRGAIAKQDDLGATLGESTGQRQTPGGPYESRDECALLSSENEQLQAKVEDLTYKNGQLEVDRTELTKRSQELESESAQLNAQIDGLGGKDAQLKKMESINSHLGKDNDQMLVDNAALVAKNKHLLGSLDENHDLLKNQDSRITDLMKDLQLHNFSLVQSHLVGLKRLVASLDTKVAVLTKNEEQATRIAKERDSKARMLRNQNANLTAQINTLNTTHQELLIRSDDLQDVAAATITRFKAATARKDELEKENSAMEPKMKKLQAQVDAMNEKKTKAEDKIRSELHVKTQAKATAEAERLAKAAAREGVDADNVIEATGRSGDGVDAADVIAAASDENTGVDAEDVEAALAP